MLACWEARELRACKRIVQRLLCMELLRCYSANAGAVNDGCCGHHTVHGALTGCGCGLGLMPVITAAAACCVSVNISCIL
jgi:hypothetical protein